MLNSSTKPYLVALGFVLSLVALIVPLILFEYPALIDYPNHLARHYITGEIPSDIQLQEFYGIDWKLIPYLASDLLALPLHKFLPTNIAEKSLLAIIAAMWLLSALVLYRVVWEEFSCWPLMSSMLFYNSLLFSGAEAFLITTCLSTVSLAAWIVMKRRNWAARTVIFVPVLFILYFGHILVFAITSFIVVAYEALPILGQRAWQLALRRVLATSALFAPGYLHFAYLMASAPPSYDRSGNLVDFGDLQDRLFTFISSGMSYNLHFDLVISCLLVAFIALGLFRGFIVIDKRFAAIIGFLACFSLLVPSTIMNVLSINLRIPGVLFLLFFAVTRYRGGSPVQTLLPVIVFVTVLAAKLIHTSLVWHSHSQQTKELTTAFAELDKGQKIMSVVDAGPGSTVISAHWFSSSYATVLASAFVPTNYTGATILSTRPEFLNIQAAAGLPMRLVDLRRSLHEEVTTPMLPNSKAGHYWRTWWTDFSHVLVLSNVRTTNPIPEFLTRLSQGTIFQIYKIDKSKLQKYLASKRIDYKG